jgi:predicted 2-oxoglutarate/Fe(II)-dependent dioxygenase YbiX
MSATIESNQAAPLILESTVDVDDFNPTADETCFCGSGKTFSTCCGSMEPLREPPYGLFMFENFIDPQLSRELTEYAEQCEGKPLMMIDEKLSTPDKIVKVQDERRITERVQLGSRRKEFQDMMGQSFIDLAERCVGVKLDWYEAPDLMRYREGGHYERHADSQNRDTETNKWHKVIDRDLSMLIYLNDGYEGGELTFNNFNYIIRPRAAAAVLFPSDHRYLHQAHTVTKGVRYAMVSWASVKGVPKIALKPPKNAVFVEHKPA